MSADPKVSKSKIAPLRGMPDILPGDLVIWQLLEKISQKLLKQYAYQEIRFPILEETALFCRAVGQETDIVNKEMYTFLDRDDKSITLRPEGTASCVRAGLSHGLFHNQTQKLWYMGPMFRYERPQKGRFRQFYQLGLEAFGYSGVSIILEQLFLIARLWQELGLQDHIRLKINTLGEFSERQKYIEEIRNYFNKNLNQLTDFQKERLSRNPLRLLDSKDHNLQDLIVRAPKLLDFVSEATQTELHQVVSILKKRGIPVEIDSKLVRGLDYYNSLVYEWVTESLGSQGTVCAGGRYDGLVSQLGSTVPVLGVGCAMGLERIVLLLQAGCSTSQSISDALLEAQKLDFYMIPTGERAQLAAPSLVEKFWDQCPVLIQKSIRLAVDYQGGKIKNQFRRADQSGAAWAMVIGDQELDQDYLTLKHLKTEIQSTVSWQDLPDWIQVNIYDQ